jgi:transposase-like protein
MHAQEKQSHVKAWQTSGLTKSAYARKHGINSKTLSRWCQLYQQETTGKLGLASVAIQPAVTSSTQKTIRLQLCSGNALELPIEISPRWLGELLQCLV